MFVSPLEWLAAFAIAFVAGVLFGKASSYARLVARHV